MNTHGLTEWKLLFDSSKKRFGVCRYNVKQISLSAVLVSLNEEHHVTDTILHEIAHALIGPREGHNYRWQSKAIEIGCNGKRTYSDEIIQPAMGWEARCTTCGKVTKRARRPKKNRVSACVNCCNAFSGGKYDDSYKLTYVRV